MIRNAIVLGALLLALAGCEGAFDNQKEDSAAMAPPGIPAAPPMESAPIVIPHVVALPLAPPPKRKPALRYEELRELQSALQRLGYDPGPIDGLYGPKTATAIRAYQTATGLPVNGRITHALLVRLLDQVRTANEATEPKSDPQAARTAEPAAGGGQQKSLIERLFGPLFGE